MKRLLLAALLLAALLGGGGYWHYRAHRWSTAHGSTVCALRNGDLVAAWYTGFDERCADVAIVLARLPAGAAEWEPPRVVADTPDRSEGNPVLWEDAHGRLHLWFATIEENTWYYFGESWEAAILKHQTSDDGGKTWSEPAVFRRERGALLRNKPVSVGPRAPEERREAVILPAYDERAGRSFFYHSGDGGLTWAEGAARVTSEPCGNIQPAVVELKNGDLVAWMRNFGGGGVLWESRSTDGGVSWSAPAKGRGIPNPNAAVDALRLASGAIALLYNDSAVEGARTPLTVGLSDDDGATFAVKRNLVEESGEFSYPSISQGGDGRLHVTFTWRREAICHMAFTEAWVRGRPGAAEPAKRMLRYAPDP
ncbi:MAG: exo-alpha-sialidase [Planctomycetes bacterium]|nr:exo-alpha-sialidase [Planctomycetota bacterium]